MAVDATDHIDPLAEFVPRHINPKPFRWDAIDPASVVVSYDRRSDTLLIHLFGRGRDTISVPVASYLYALVTPKSEAVVGFHIEGFLSQAVKDIPAAIDLLDYAEVRGITPAEVDALQREMLGNGLRRRLGAKSRPALEQRVQEQRMLTVTAFVEAARSRWHLSFVPTAS